MINMQNGYKQTEVGVIPEDFQIGMPGLDSIVYPKMQRISQLLTQRIKELADRYDAPMPALLDEVTLMEEKVNAHLTKMGFVWK